MHIRYKPFGLYIVELGTIFIRRVLVSNHHVHFYKVFVNVQDLHDQISLFPVPLNMFLEQHIEYRSPPSSLYGCVQSHKQSAKKRSFPRENARVVFFAPRSICVLNGIFVQRKALF